MIGVILEYLVAFFNVLILFHQDMVLEQSNVVRTWMKYMELEIYPSVVGAGNYKNDFDWSIAEYRANEEDDSVWPGSHGKPRPDEQVNLYVHMIGIRHNFQREGHKAQQASTLRYYEKSSPDGWKYNTARSMLKLLYLRRNDSYKNTFEFRVTSSENENAEIYGSHLYL